MIMPFIRLVAIYVVVILAVVAFFNRDRLLELAGVSSDVAQQSDAADTAKAGDQPDQTPASAEAQTEAAPSAASRQAAIQNPTAPTPAPAAATQQMPSNEPRPALLPIVRPTAEPEAAPAPAQTQATQTQAAETAGAGTGNNGNLQSRLGDARRAFWEGNLDKAQTLFAALAADAPENADVNGELGNVYFAQRKFDEAAASYLAAGKLLAANGQQAQAMQLVNVLQSISPERASELRAAASN